jgi:hypothetical protein
MTMSEDRSRCEHCNGTGTFAGKVCRECGGEGYLLKIEDDKPPRPRLDRRPRKPRTNREGAMTSTLNRRGFSSFTAGAASIGVWRSTAATNLAYENPREICLNASRPRYRSCASTNFSA